ncbi:ArgP/LysG family DNA-binding transcriptional regulator [Bacterioplanes sanyensis]|uniref:ArgP/LysG family DNA-binding transcriptional regulator n=1 Tax=Bacterioplanes sanyensis TaxID=1249553 RepID=A0A222FH59_9GAMM|nr:LysR family transcriptional regulator ArgP [Bacterioplanes sanyensis]ASP38090.1 ArgP/LysG family DNA-binding transcriptional regulator [Bacterioplanes sanyensis]
MLDYPALQALVAVIEARGFDRAAQRLSISQSAVSQRIRQLEFKLGQPVLLRTSPPRPTELGQRLANHLQQVQQLEQALSTDDDADKRLRVRLAVNADSIDTWLPQALSAASVSRRMDFDFVVEDQDVGLKRMKNGEVMACICASEQPVNGGLAQYLGSIRYRALASPEFKQQYRAQLAGAELDQIPCLIYSADDRLQHRFLQAQGVGDPKYNHLCPSSYGFVNLALAGLGYGMMPELQVQPQLRSGALVDLVAGYEMDVPMYWHYWQTESPALAELRQAVVQVAQQHLRLG